MNAECDHWKEVSEDRMHLIYGCHNVNWVWENLGKILNFFCTLETYCNRFLWWLFFLIQSLHIYLIKSINSKCHAEYKTLNKVG